MSSYSKMRSSLEILASEATTKTQRGQGLKDLLKPPPSLDDVNYIEETIDKYDFFDSTTHSHIRMRERVLISSSVKEKMYKFLEKNRPDVWKNIQETSTIGFESYFLEENKKTYYVLKSKLDNSWQFKCEVDIPTENIIRYLNQFLSDSKSRNIDSNTEIVSKSDIDGYMMKSEIKTNHVSKLIERINKKLEVFIYETEKEYQEQYVNREIKENMLSSNLHLPWFPIISFKKIGDFPYGYTHEDPEDSNNPHKTIHKKFEDHNGKSIFYLLTIPLSEPPVTETSREID